MSARAKKTTVKSHETRKQTPVKSQASVPRERSCSPLSISRHEEKDELAHLNTRLAGYIEYVRELEKDKERLSNKISAISEENFDKSQSIRDTYEKEIKSLRNLVDDYANKNAQNEIEAKSAKQQAAESRALLNKLEHENHNLEKELLACRTNPEKMNKLQKENDQFKKRYDAIRSDLDNQIILRTELENRITSLTEELDFQKRILNEERQGIDSRSVDFEDTISKKKAAEYESRLAEELREIRAQTVNELQSYKIEMEHSFSMQIEQLRTANSNSHGESSKLREEISTMRRRFDDLNNQLEQKASEADMCRRRMKDMERQIEDERKDFSLQTNELKVQIMRLNEELQARLNEFTDLLHAKISLDQEIIMYRKMLENEESRLNIPTPSRSSSFTAGPSAGKKRRLDFDTMEDSVLSGNSYLGFSRPRAQFAYQVTSDTIGDLEFDSEQNGKGRWVRLIHKSNSGEVDISGWTLNHVADGKEVDFKFPANTKVQKGATLTLFSSDAGVDANPPSVMVMPKGHFFAGSLIQMELVDATGSPHATCTVTKERIRQSGSRFTNGSEERCLLM